MSVADMSHWVRRARGAGIDADANSHLIGILGSLDAGYDGYRDFIQGDVLRQDGPLRGLRASRHCAQGRLHLRRHRVRDAGPRPSALPRLGPRRLRLGLSRRLIVRHGAARRLLHPVRAQETAWWRADERPGGRPVLLQVPQGAQRARTRPSSTALAHESKCATCSNSAFGTCGRSARAGAGIDWFCPVCIKTMPSKEELRRANLREAPRQRGAESVPAAGGGRAQRHRHVRGALSRGYAEGAPRRRCGHHGAAPGCLCCAMHYNASSFSGAAPGRRPRSAGSDAAPKDVHARLRQARDPAQEHRHRARLRIVIAHRADLRARGAVQLQAGTFSGQPGQSPLSGADPNGASPAGGERCTIRNTSRKRHRWWTGR